MASGQGGNSPPDLQAIALDWITIWHSELAAMATDRELQDTWTGLVRLWAQSAEAAARLLPAIEHDSAGGRSVAVPSPGAASAVATPDARDATLRDLEDRVARLERRIVASTNGGDIAGT